MLKLASRVLVLLALMVPAAFCQTTVKVDSAKVTFMAPTGIFVPKGETITINATGTVTLTDPNGSGSFTVNAIGVIQTAPDSNTDKSFYSFLTNQALPPLLPPSPGELKFPPAGTGATLIGAYGALVLGLSPNQCNASSTADFPNGFINPGTGAGPLPVSGGYIYLGVQRDNEVTVSGTYAVSISLSGSASPPTGCNGGLEALDLNPDFLLPATNKVITNPNLLSFGGRAVKGAVADGVTQVLIRAQGMDSTHTNFVVLLDENNQVAPANGEDGTLVSIFSGAIPAGPAIIPAIQVLNGINYMFVAYQPPADYARASGLDNATAGRKVGIIVFDSTTNTVVAGTQLNLLRPPVFFVHGLWAAADTWLEFNPALAKAFPPISADLPGITMYAADYEQTNGDHVGKNTFLVLGQALDFLRDFRKDNDAAASQMDFIVHSMGGLISNNMPTVPGFYRQENYFHGIIHKLITIDTPYQGSPLASNLQPSSPACKSLLLSTNHSVGGAVDDLVVGSPFLKQFDAHPDGYYKHAIASFVTPGEESPLEAAINNEETSALTTQAAAYKGYDVCNSVLETPITPAGQFAFSKYFLTAADTTYQGNNDLVVSELSELGGYIIGTTADATSGLAHSHAPLPFVAQSPSLTSIPGCLDADIGSPVANTSLAINLLNSPVSAPLFEFKKPTP